MVAKHLFEVKFTVGDTPMNEAYVLPYRTEEWDVDNRLEPHLTHNQAARAAIAKDLGCRRTSITITEIYKIHNNLIIEEYGK